MSVLIVELIEAKDIGNAAKSTTALFCTVGVGGTRKKSKTIRNTLEPKWEQGFEFDVDPSALPPCVVTLQDKGLFGSTGLGQITVKTAKKLAGASQNEGWYPLQPSKSGKPTSGALRIRLRLVKKSTLDANASRSISKKKSSQVIATAGQIFTFIRNNDVVGLDEFLESATPDMVNEPEDKTGNTPLHSACLDCKSVDERIIHSLLRFEGIKAEVPNANKNTPLHYYCAKWQLPDLTLMELLLKKGANVNAINDNGETPIFKAIFNDSIRTLLIEKLLEHGANVDLLNSFGEGILHYAIRLGRSDLVNLILTATPKLDIKGKDGLTPYQVAVQYKFKNIATHLKKVGELFAWLDENDLGEFKGTFLKNEIFKNLLSDMTDDILEKMQVEPAARKKILDACKKLEREEAEADVIEDDRAEVDETKAAQLKQEIVKEDSQDWILDGKDLEYLKRLGSGTSGDVFKGLYKGKHVAIKVLKEMTEDKERDEFKKEFVIMSSLGQRNVNIVYFYGASFKPKLCMVMEYCARGSLYHCLKDESTEIGWDRAFQIMKQTVNGIGAMHSNVPQIMHRDLKSLNLLVTDDWHIKVADFGLSRFDTAEALETLKQMRGTFAYCAPESYTGEKYTIKSDIYSMGIIFWELVNRVVKGKYEQPYSEYKNIQFDFQIIIQASKSDLRPTIPESTPDTMANIIRLCIHKERDQRPTCEKLTELIEACEKDFLANRVKWDKALIRNNLPTSAATVAKR